MNTKFGTEGKHNFEKDFFKLMDSSVFGETMETVRKNRYIKHVTLNKERSCLASEPNDHTTNSESLLAIEMKKSENG